MELVEVVKQPSCSPDSKNFTGPKEMPPANSGDNFPTERNKQIKSLGSDLKNPYPFVSPNISGT